MYKVKVFVTLRKSILDPKGKATHHALHSLGLDGVKDVRIGKMIELDIDADNKNSAQEIAQTATEKLLANPVMEDYEIEVKEI